MLKMRKIELKGIMLLSVAFLFLIGCVPEKKIAAEYLTTRQNINIVLRAPQWVKMVSQIPDSIDSIPNMIEEDKYYAKLKKSRIISELSESILMNNYITSMKRGLELMGYKTYLVSDQDTIMPVKDNAILINIGQIELDEGIHPIRDEVKYKNHVYTADFDLGKIELHFWIELNRLENGVPAKSPRVFYTTFNKISEFEGHFNLDEATNTMKYYSKSLDITRAYVMGTMIKLGYNHAIGLNTLLMNEYIGYKLPDKPNRALLSVDNEFGSIYQIDELPFTELKEEP